MQPPEGKINDLEGALQIYDEINPNWLVSLSADGEHVILDGNDFSAEQLEAIAFLLRHAPDELT